MKKLKNYWLAATAFTLLGCNSVELSFVPLYVVRPEATENTANNTITCDFGTADPMPFVTINVAEQSAFTMVIRTENRLQETQLTLQQDGITEELAIPNTIQPVRFDFRWECESNGFTAGQEALRLPAFSADRAFCLDRRDETTGNFTGFDTIQASGPSILPGEEGNINIRIAPPQMISAVADAFQIAQLAESCCREAGSCELAAQGVPEDFASCQQLQGVFDGVGGDLRANSLDALTLWRPFVVHTSAVNTPVPYNMRLRGRFEGVLPDGSLITSTDFLQDVGFCEGCAAPIANVCLDR